MTYDKKKYAENKRYRDSIKKASSKWYQKNKEDLIRKQQEYNKDNDAYREYMRSYMQKRKRFGL